MEEFRYSFRSSMLLVFIIFIGVVVYMFFMGEEWFYIAVYPVVFLGLLINQYFTRYYINANSVIVKDIFTKKQVNFNQIRKVRKEEISWFGQFFSGRPKTSVRITYNKFDEVEVFPQNIEKFVSSLNQHLLPREML